MIDWNDYFALAKSLQSTPTEASLRSAISRAYYALFNLAHKVVEGRGHEFPKYSNKHEAVYYYFSLNNEPSIASKLESLRKLRNTSDYDETFTTRTYSRAHKRTIIKHYKNLKEIGAKTGSAIVDAHTGIQAINDIDVNKKFRPVGMDGNDEWELK